jgi:hypothetical protein
MKTFLLFKKTDDFQQQVVHLYEHLFLQSFISFVKQKMGMAPNVTNFLAGETFDNVVFVEAWFYDGGTAKLWKRFLKKGQLSFDLLELCIAQCEAESRVTIKVKSKKKLMNALTDIHALHWETVMPRGITGYNDEKSTTQPLITFQKAARNFKSIAISAYIENATAEQVALFSRLSVIVQGLITDYVIHNGWYENGAALPRQQDRYTLSAVSATLPRQEKTTQHIERELEYLIRNFDVSTHKKILAAHFKAYANQPLWVGEARHKLHYLNVIVGNQAIQSLATVEEMKELMALLSVRVETISHSDATQLN